MEVLRAPAWHGIHSAFGWSRTARSREGLGQVGGDVAEEETVDLQLAVGGLRTP